MPVFLALLAAEPACGYCCCAQVLSVLTQQ
jgi:hypothetical protein